MNTDGNLIDDGETLYNYNGENRLIEVYRKLDNALLATYHYDEQGRRIRKTTTIDASQGATDILFLWDNWLNIAELDHDSLTNTISPRNYYTWGNDLSDSEQGTGGVGGLLFIRHFPADETHAYTYDGNGNVTGLYAMDNAGAESAKYEYAPFGEPLQATGPLADENPYRFSTKYHDEETEFLYYGYRYYTPATGRWINRDPLEEDGSLNISSLANNDLINLIDYLGLNATSSSSIGLTSNELKKRIDSLARNDVRRFFLEVQLCILEKLAKGKCCVQAKENEEWLEKVVNTFMKSLFDALDGSVNKTNHQWEYVLKEMVPREQTRVGKSTHGQHPPHLRVASQMAITHIEQDLRNAITLHGAGSDDDWKCIGNVVSECESSRVSLGMRIASFILNEDVSGLRDRMRDQVKRTENR